MSRRSPFTVFDISRPLAAAEPLYPGNPRVSLRWAKTWRRDKSNHALLSSGVHNGTHVDAPFHAVPGGRTVEKLALEQCLGWARVYDCTKCKEEITEKEIAKLKLTKGEVVLFKTSNSRRIARFNPRFVHLTEAAARMLIKAGIKAVGTDGPSIKKFRLRPDTVHPRLLRAGIPVYEGLYLPDIKPGRYFFVGAPIKITGADASPVRAFLMK